MIKLTQEDHFYEEGEHCGRCLEERPVLDVGDFGSDPYIANLLCHSCLLSLAATIIKFIRMSNLTYER